MPSWKWKQIQRRRRKVENRAQATRKELRLRSYYASMFITCMDYFVCFLRPLEVRALMSLSRESRSRDWERLLTQYMRFYYHQDFIRLFGMEWVLSWQAPVRTKLAAVLNRACVCGAVTDHFDHVVRTRLCVPCARATLSFAPSLTTPLFYDDEVYATVNMWTPDPVALLQSVPIGKRVEVDGVIVVEYDNIMIAHAIWISGLGSKRSTLRMGCFGLILRGSVYVTDLGISNGPYARSCGRCECACEHTCKLLWPRPTLRDAHHAVVVIPFEYDQTVKISNCFISGRAGAGVHVLGSVHVILRHNYFKWCAYAAISVSREGTVHAMGNRFRRLRTWCFQTNARPDDAKDFIATFLANNDIRSPSPHFCFPRRPITVKN